MMKHIRQLAILTMLIIPSLMKPRTALTQKSQTAKPIYVLDCRGVTSASTSLKQDGPKATIAKSTDELRIARYGSLLKVQINSASLQSADKKTRELLEQPDSYKITAETGEGYVAVLVNGSTTLHTLTIDKSLKNGIWTESGFSFLEPQSEPISSTVFFTCTQEKQ